MQSNTRRYDIDSLRVIALFLLIFYHAAGFILYDGPFAGYYELPQSMDWLIALREFLHTWRLPLLFFVSGMGVFFAFRKRTGKQLFRDRAERILIPLVFGSFCIVPIQMLFTQHIEHRAYSYLPAPSHLWFLLVIMIYVVLLLPVFSFLKKRPDLKWMIWFQNTLSKSTLTIYLLAIPHIALGLLNGVLGFADTLVIYFVDFFLGFFILLFGEKIWHAFDRLKMVNVVVAVVFQFMGDYVQEAGAIFIIFSIFGFGYRYFNRPIPLFLYANKAVLPIYMIHWVVLYAIGIVVLPLAMPAWIKFIVVIVLTIGLCFAIYEWVIKRTKWLHRWFGMGSEK